MVLVKVSHQGNNKGTWEPNQLLSRFGVIQFEYLRNGIYCNGLYEGRNKQLYYLKFNTIEEE